MEQTAKLQLNKLDLTLRLNFHAMMVLKRETGVDLLKDASSGRLTEVDVLPVVIWAMAGGDGSGATVEDIARNLDLSNMADATAALEKVLAPDPSSLPVAAG